MRLLGGRADQGTAVHVTRAPPTDFDESVKSFRPYYYAEQARVHFLLGREERIHLCDDLRVLRAIATRL